MEQSPYTLAEVEALHALSPKRLRSLGIVRDACFPRRLPVNARLHDE